MKRRKINWKVFVWPLVAIVIIAGLISSINSDLNTNVEKGEEVNNTIICKNYTKLHIDYAPKNYTYLLEILLNEKIGDYNYNIFEVKQKSSKNYIINNILGASEKISLNDFLEISEIYQNRNMLMFNFCRLHDKKEYIEVPCNGINFYIGYLYEIKTLIEVPSFYNYYQDKYNKDIVFGTYDYKIIENKNIRIQNGIMTNLVATPINVQIEITEKEFEVIKHQSEVCYN